MVQYYSTMMQDFLYTFFATPFSILLGSQVLNITQSTGGNVSQTIILYVLYLLGNWLFLTAYSTLMENLHKTIHHGGIYEHRLWNRTDRPHSSLNHEKGFEHMSQDFQKVLRYTYSLPRSCKGHLM